MLLEHVKINEEIAAEWEAHLCAHKGCTKVGTNHVAPGRRLCDAHLIKHYPSQLTWPDIEARNEAEDNSPAHQHPEGL